MLLRLLNRLLIGVLALGAALQALAQSPSAPPIPPQSCDLSADMPDPVGALDHTARAVRAGRKLTVIVVGSLSSTPRGLPLPSDAYPIQFQLAMKWLLPGSDVEVIVHAKQDARAADQAEQMAELIKRDNATLVIWQTGSVEAARRLDAPDLGEAILKGIQAARANRADLLLITPQFSGSMATLVDPKPYVDVIRQVADYNAVPVFDRYEAMRQWIDDGRLRARVNNKEEAQQAGLFLHRCVGQLLAQIVHKMVQQASIYCPPAGGYADLGVRLTRVGERLERRQTIKIVAIGSSSTAGSGATTPARSYPERLARELSRLWPHNVVTVLNKGAGGEEVPQMVARFERDVVAEKPDLVIWQLGTNSILRSDGVSRYEPTIQDGIRKLKATGADVIVMDPQYAPKVTGDPDYREMVRIIDRTARIENAALFRRFHIMRQWVRGIGVDLESLVTADGLHHTDRGYACIAEVLAMAIDAAARGTPLEQR